MGDTEINVYLLTKRNEEGMIEVKEDKSGNITSFTDFDKAQRACSGVNGYLGDSEEYYEVSEAYLKLN